jgi:F-type H+-transporting ATPase subunit a
MEEVFPKVVFYIAGIPVRDTVISTWVMIALIIGIAWFVRRRLPLLAEALVDFVRSSIESVMGSSVAAERFIPFLGSQILFLLFANNIGIVPLMATPTRDINTPVALAVVLLFAAHVFGVAEKGLAGYLKELASPMLILDVIGQLSRTLSLSLRLFGNIIAGEIIVAVVYRLVKPVVPLAMVGLGLITGVLQAYVFMVLSTSAIAATVRQDDPAG